LIHSYTSFIRQKTAENTKATIEKAEHAQITTIRGCKQHQVVIPFI